MKKKFDLPKLISLNNFKDKRGSLARIFCTNEFTKKGINISIKQINHVIVKKKGTIKGMHFQLQPFSEMKIVKVIRGKIFDVVIDVRKNTKNFLSYKKFTLDSNENKCLIIPKGFAHGFQTLNDKCEIDILGHKPESGGKYLKKMPQYFRKDKNLDTEGGQ